MSTSACPFVSWCVPVEIPFMKQNIFKLPLLAMAWAIAAVPSLNGADPVSVATNQITLDELVNEIVGKNPELNFYRAEIAAAKGERRAAAIWANPELSTSVGQKRVTSGGLSAEGVAWSVSVQQTFDWPGRIPLRKAIANHQIQLAELGFEQFRAALTSRARTLTFNLFAAQEKA